ncbi:MAG: hypothetical protein RJQ10_08535 [Haliea sp.]|uniref:hypothetical protein n=1 Tax=Haliea sp. TaxID=1932666 RepID=UPI0032EDD865
MLSLNCNIQIPHICMFAQFTAPGNAGPAGPYRRRHTLLGLHLRRQFKYDGAIFVDMVDFEHAVPELRVRPAHRPKEQIKLDQELRVENRTRRRYSRNQQRAIKYMLVSLVLGALLMVTGIGWMVTAYKLSETKQEFFSRHIPSPGEGPLADDLRSRVSALEQEVLTLQEEKASLVQNRIPNLNPMAFDATVPIDQGYVKNIRFTRTGTEIDRKFEYYAVLQNNGARNITPDVVIYLFDSLGIQIGMARLANSDTSLSRAGDSLKEGESRTYSSQVELIRERDPEYFHIEVK